MGPSPRLELRFVSDAPPQSSYDCLPRFPLSDLEPPTFTPLPARLGPPCCETCESHIIYGNYAVRLIKIKLGVCVGYRIVCHGAWPFPYKYSPTGVRLHWPLKPVDSSAEMSDGPESPFYFRENDLLLVRLQRRDALIKRANIISRIGLRVVDFATT
jgi:hypothetical protein